MLLARTLRRLLAKAAEGGGAVKPEGVGDGDSSGEAHDAAGSDDASRHAMESEVSAAYVALLLGFICHHDPSHAEDALAELNEANFQRIGALLASYVPCHPSPLPTRHCPAPLACACLSRRRNRVLAFPMPRARGMMRKLPTG